jgi:hypothetical protein
MGRHGLKTSSSATASPLDRDAGVQQGLRAKLWAHLLRDRRLVLVGNLTFAALLSVVLWPSAPRALLAGWLAAAVCTGALRASWPRRAEVATVEDVGVLRGTRLVVLLNGLAWGVGAALVIARLPLREAAAVLIVLFALVIGSIGTLAADPPAFYRFLAAVAGPLPVGLLARGWDPPHLAVAAASLALAGIPIARYRAGHNALVEWLRAAVLAEENQQTLLRELQTALAEVKTLRGLIRICAHCKRVLSDEGSWEQLESYVRGHSDVEFSHGICPDCARAWGDVPRSG